MKKKLNLILVLAVISLGFYTSCTPEATEIDPPTITVTSPTSDTTTVKMGDAVEFSITLTSENGLVSLTPMSNVAGVEFSKESFSFSSTASETVSLTATVTNAVPVGTVVEVIFTVTDGEKSANAKKYIVVGETPLSAAKDFTWIREGGVPATGLDIFGLSFTKTIGSVEDGFFARIEVASNGATKFVELESTAWITITTAEALKTAIDAATAITDGKWSKISASKSATYDYVLGVIYQDVYYMIHITNGKVESVTAGTKVTINGQYKN